MPKLMRCLESGKEESITKLKRMHIGHSSNLNTIEKHWFNDALEHFQSDRDYQMFAILPKTKVGAHPLCAWKVMMDMNEKWKILGKRKVYLLQIGPYPEFLSTIKSKSGSTFWELLAKFLEAYFPGLEIQIHEPMINFFEEYEVTLRQHRLTGKDQYLASDIHHYLQRLLPNDAMSILAVTWTDLYPSEDLNFVLGEACFEKNCAVFCFGRFQPKLVAKTGICEDITQISGDLVYRLLRVVTHETCHLFGLRHCVYFHCAMNGSDSLDLALSQPLLCCPFCLRKIQYVLKFPLKDYFSNLNKVCSQIHEQFPSEFWSCALNQMRHILQRFDEMQQNV